MTDVPENPETVADGTDIPDAHTRGWYGHQPEDDRVIAEAVSRVPGVAAVEAAVVEDIDHRWTQYGVTVDCTSEDPEVWTALAADVRRAVAEVWPIDMGFEAVRIAVTHDGAKRISSWETTPHGELMARIRDHADRIVTKASVGAVLTAFRTDPSFDAPRAPGDPDDPNALTAAAIAALLLDKEPFPGKPEDELLVSSVTRIAVVGIMETMYRYGDHLITVNGSIAVRSKRPSAVIGSGMRSPAPAHSERFHSMTDTRTNTRDSLWPPNFTWSQAGDYAAALIAGLAMERAVGHEEGEESPHCLDLATLGVFVGALRGLNRGETLERIWMLVEPEKARSERRYGRDAGVLLDESNDRVERQLSGAEPPGVPLALQDAEKLEAADRLPEKAVRALESLKLARLTQTGQYMAAISSVMRAAIRHPDGSLRLDPGGDEPE